MLCEKWIWLDENRYPDRQNTIYSGLTDKSKGNYTVAEFKRSYVYQRNIVGVKLRFSGDTEFQLFCNGELLATGPACVGGDFLGNDRPRSWFYSTETEYLPRSNRLDFFARVKMMPVKMCEYSKGHGGFMLSAEVVLDDGSCEVITTDSTWEARLNGAYREPYLYDARVTPDPFYPAEVTENIWNTETAPIPPRTEKEIFPENGNITLRPNEEKETVLPFDMIYAGFIHVKARTEGAVTLEIACRETDEEGTRETVVLNVTDGEYRGFTLHSVGNFSIKLKNESETISDVSIGLITTFYPINDVCITETNDKELNSVLDVCRHTLKYCRQSIHLDSPRHCEPLACTGDYYIESLMTSFSFGDMALSRFDIVRTANLLRSNDGRMFHTTYSLIWVRMLYDVYMISGDISLLTECLDALKLLLDRFETYMGENGLVETPPDYMFVDWIYIDGISLHHPPKALGQSSLNMFCLGALKTAKKIYEAVGDAELAEKYSKKSESLRKAINGLLYDKENGLYFEGLNTKSPEENLSHFHPQNVSKRYYLKQSNILAAYVGACDGETAVSIIDKIMSDECPGDYQPYFAHYLLEAIYDNGLKDRYTLSVLERWKAPVRECSKGLVEGFIAPEPSYKFDHSHAWGGTPLYSLPKALLGLKILSPGYKEIELSPSLLGLERARVELPTPLGKLVCSMEKGASPVISAPNGIKVHIK